MLRSRKFWLAIAALCVVVATVGFGVNEEKAQQIADSAVAILGVLIVAIAVEDGAAKLANGKAPTPAQAPDK